MPTPEERKARLREIQAPAKAECRDLTPEEDRELTRAVFACIGEDVTDRSRLHRQPDGTDLLILNGEAVGVVNWKPGSRKG